MYNLYICHLMSCTYFFVLTYTLSLSRRKLNQQPSIYIVFKYVLIKKGDKTQRNSRNLAKNTRQRLVSQFPVNVTIHFSGL